MPSSSSFPDRLPGRSFAILFSVQLVAAIGNTGLISVLPSISRSTGVPDEAAVAIFALSSLFWALCSPMWARASDLRGRRPLIVLGLCGYTGAQLLALVVVAVGLAGLTPWIVTFAGLFLSRGLFGLLGSAASPASQAYLAEYTPPERRTAAISSLAGAWGLGTVIGPLLAPLLVLPLVGLSGPLVGFFAIGVVLLAAAVRWLPESELRGPAEAAARAAKASGEKLPPMWKDPRLTPFLIYGFLMSVCQTAQTQTLGFVIIDTMRISPAQAQGFIAVAMMFGAVAGLLAQWGLIRMFDMTPRQLLRWGVAVAAVGNVIVVLSPGYWGLVLGFAVSSLGFGFSRPGFSAGASLSVNLREQARAAGAIALANGANGMLAPGFVWLYRHVSWGPFALNAAILTGLLVYAFVNVRLRQADPHPTTKEDTARATLEGRDEGELF